MRWPFLLTFRMRLLVLVGIAVFPALAFILMNADRDRESARDQATRQATDVASIVNQSISSAVVSTSQSLATVGNAILAGAVVPGTPGCDDLARSAAANLPDLLLLAVTTSTGEAVCSSGTTPAARDLGALQSFVRARDTGARSLGDFERDPISGKPTAWLAQPVVEANRVRFIAVAAFDLEANSQGIIFSGLPAGTLFYVLDREGRVSLAGPPSPESLGAPPPVAGLVEAVKQRGTGTVESEVAGKSHMFGFQPLLLPGELQGYTVVALPTAPIYGPANDRLWWNVAGLAVASALAAAAALLGGQFFFIRRVRDLVTGTREVAGGNFGVRIPTVGRDELSTLGRSFNEMTAELAANRLAADEAATQIRAVFDATTEGLVVSDPDTALTVEVNPAICQLLGFEREELIGLHPARFIHGSDRAKFAQIIPRALAGPAFRERATMLRKDGQPFTADVSAIAFLYKGRRHVLSTVLDVSQQVANERVLEERVAERTAELQALLGVAGEAARAMEVRRVAAVVLEHLRRVLPATYMVLASRESAGRVTVEGAIDGDGITLEPLIGAVLQAGTDASPWTEALAEGRPFIHGDFFTGDGYASEYRHQMGRFLYLAPVRKARSAIVVPLTHQGEVAGILGLFREEAGSFQEEDGALAMGFAAQAAVAFANARLFEEAGERAREVTALLDTATAVSSTIDLGSLVETLLGRAESTIGFDAATLLTVEGEDAVVIAARLAGGTPVLEMEGFRISLRGELQPFLEGLRRREATVIPDLTDLTGGAALYRDALGRFIALAPYQAARSFLSVPLVHQERLLGFLVLLRNEPDAFGRRQVSLALGFAAHAGAALEHARLFHEADVRNGELQTLLEVAGSVGSTLELQPLLLLVLTQLKKVVDYSQASISEIDDLGALRVIASQRGDGEVNVAPMGRRFAEWTRAAPGTLDLYRSGEVTVIRDVQSSSQSARQFRAAIGEGFDVFRETRSWLGVPLLVNGRLIGLLSASHVRVSGFTEHDADLAKAFAAPAATAIANARLFHEADVRNSELETLLEVAASVGSTLELEPLLLVVLAQLKKVVDYTHVAISEIDDHGALSVVASQRGDGERTVAQAGSRSAPWTTVAPATLARYKAGEVTLIADTQAGTPKATAFRESMADALDVYSQTRSWLGVPLLVNGRLIGLLTMAHAEPDGFGERDTGLAKAFAAPVAAAIANARLFEAEQRRAQQNEALAALAAGLRVGEPITATLSELTNRIVASTGAVACVVTVASKDRGVPIRIGGAGFRPGYVEASPPAIAAQVLERAALAAAEGRWEVVQDGRAQLMETSAVAPLRSYLEDAAWDHIAIVPLVYAGEIGGAITLCYRTMAELEGEDQAFIRTLADQVGLALETSRLFDETKRQARENAALAQVAAEFLAGGETAVVLQRAAKSVCEVTGALAATVVILEPGGIAHLVGHGVPPEFAITARRGYDAGGVTAVTPAIASQTAISVHLDPATFAPFPEWADHVAVLDSAGLMGKWIAVTPLVYRGVASGTLMTFHDDCIDAASPAGRFLRALADQIGIGAASLRLFDEAEQQAREKAALATVASQLTLDLPVRDVLDGIAEAVVRSTAGTLACAIYLLDEDDDRFQLAGACGVDPWLWDLLSNLPESAEQGRRAALERNDPTIVPRFHESLAAHEGVSPESREAALALPWRTTIMVPMRSRGRPAGTLVVAYADEAVPAASEVQLLAAVADQAAAAIENASLFAKTERRAKESAALAATASSLTLDQPLRRTLDTIAANAAGVSGALATMLLIMDERTGAVTDVGSVGLPEALLDQVRSVIGLSTEAYSVEALVRGEPVLLPDAVSRLVSNPAYESLHGLAAALPFEAILFVPLIYRGRRIGVLNAGFAAGSLPNAEMQRILLGIANQAAVAIANVRLFEQTEQRVRELEAFQRIAESTTLVRPIDETLDTLAASVVEATDAIACTVTLTDPDSLVITLCRGVGLPDGYTEGIFEAFSDPRWKHGLERFAREDQIVTLEDARQRILDEPLYAPVHRFMTEVEWTTTAILPMRVQDRVVGALTAYFPPKAPAAGRRFEFFNAIADQAAIAVENARLYSEADEQAREQQAIGRIAAILTVDRSLEGVLSEIAQTTAEGTRALGVALVVLGEDGSPPTIGDFGMPEGYGAGMIASRVQFASYWDEVNQNTEAVTILNARAEILANPAYAPVHHLIDGVEWDTLVRVPFIHRERVRGLVALFLPPGGVEAREMRLFRALADQASIAAESAYLYAEASRRAREQAALAAIAAAATVDEPIDQLLGTLSEIVANSTGAIGASVTLANWENDSDRLVSGSHGLPEGYISAFMRAAVEAQGRGNEQLQWGRAETPEIFRGVRRFFAEDPEFIRLRPYADVPWDTVVRISFFYHQRARGILVVYLAADHAPSASLVQAVKALAGQVGVAVENVSLFHQVDERTRYLEALYAAEEALHRSLKLEEVLEAVFDVVINLLRSDGAAMILIEPNTTRPRVLAKTRSGPVAVSVLESVEASFGNDPQLVRDLRAIEPGEVRVTSDTATSDDAAFRQRTVDLGVSALLEVSLSTSGGMLGLLEALYLKPRAFTEAEKRVFAALAKRVAVALDNARLYEQAESLAATQERQRLARELHDSVSQALYGIALGARTARTLLDRDATKAVEPVDYVLQLAEAGLAEMRALIFELRPESLAEQGLVVAIEKQAASLRARYGIPVTSTLCEEPELPLSLKEALYRVAQEAMHNVVKHARATRVEVSLATEGPRITLDLRDNGQGFDPAGEFPGHLGLRSMRERVSRAGGTFEVTSAPGLGTHVHVEVVYVPVEGDDLQRP